MQSLRDNINYCCTEVSKLISSIVSFLTSSELLAVSAFAEAASSVDSALLTSCAVSLSAGSARPPPAVTQCHPVPHVPGEMFQHPPQRILKDLLWYPLGREGVYAPGGHVCLAHFMQKFSYIVDLTVLRLALFMGYE